MNRTVLASTLALSLVAIGCATPTIQDDIKSGKATLLVDTIAVTPFGTNYKISGLVETAHGRASVDAFATDCEAGYGWLLNQESDQSTYISFNNLVVGRMDPPDRLYTILCGRGLPMAQQMEGQLTAVQREQRERAARATAKSVVGFWMQEDAQRAREAQRNQAIRAAGEAVGDAIREQGQKPVDCQPSGLGVTCQSR